MGPVEYWLRQLQGVCRQLFKRNKVQRAYMCCLKHDRRRDARSQRLSPAKRAKTPAVPGLEPREAICRDRGLQVIAPGTAEGQKLCCHAGADDVGAAIFLYRMAPAIAKIARQRGKTAGLKGPAQNVLGGH